MANKKMELKLLGTRMLIKSSDMDPELSEQVVDLVTSKVKEAEGRVGKSVPPHQIALLAMLELAEEYLRAKSRTVEYKRKMSAKSTQLLGLVEAGRR